MSDTGPSTVYYILAIILVASSLVGMRLPIAKVAKMALAWVAIFGAGFVLFSFRGEFSAGPAPLCVGARNPVRVRGRTPHPDGEDGHFWVRGSVNGESVKFLVDSGATMTTMSADTARAAGVVRHEPADRRQHGQRPDHHVARLCRPPGGRLDRAERFPGRHHRQDDINMLGMNFLSSLSSWRVEGAIWSCGHDQQRAAG